MDAEKCRLLLGALDNGSISEASRIMGYTPSGISKAITSLENEAGFSLINRSRNGVTPTAECEMLLPLIREFVSAMEKIKQTAAGIKGIEIGTLSIGSSYNVYYRWLTEKVAEFFADHPGIKVQAYSDVSTKLKEALDNHQMDACIMSRREGNHEWIHLKWDQLVVLVPKNHPYVARGSFPLRALATEPYIKIYPGHETDNSIMLDKNNIKPRVQFICADAQAALPIVEAGLGVCIVNELIADSLVGDFVSLQIHPQQLVDIGIALPSTTATSPLIKSFVEYLQEKTHEVI